MKSETESTPFDIAIIGGGIAGAGIARDAALRGISAVLFEKNTFGSGTSAKSSKLIHGGLRYLDVAWKHLKRGQILAFWKNFRFVFLALRETHRLQRIAPSLIHPLPLLLPIYRTTGRSPASVYFGTLLYGILSRISGGHLTEPLWNKEAVLQRVPVMNQEGLAGGVIVWDHITDDQKLVEATISSAVHAGAAAFENAKVVRYHFHLQKKLYEIAVSINGVHQLFYAHKLINASGPWLDEVRELGHERKSDLIFPVAGAHVNLVKFINHSVILEAEDGRLFFAIARQNDVRVGTTERVHFDPDRLEPTADEVNYLMRSLRKFFPGVIFKKDDILAADAGIRPLAKPRTAASPNEVSREHEFTAGPTGVIHAAGIKLTDHRRAAEELMNELAHEIKKWNPAAQLQSSTADKPL